MKKNQSPEIDLRPFYFELQATLGITNHMGGLKATKELAELCNINPETSLLNVGCGIGATSFYIADTYNCHVVSVDIREEMVARSKKTAQKKGITRHAEFLVADALNLPFKHNSFDVVISESVTAFVPDRQRAVTEYTRVTKPGGYIGLNEAAWITPPPQELVDYFYSIMGVNPESPEGWEELLKGSGLHDIVVNSSKTTYRSQFANEIKMTGFAELFRPWGRLIKLYFKSPVYRKVIHGMARGAMSIPRNLFDYFGYGLFVGRK